MSDPYAGQPVPYGQSRPPMVAERLVPGLSGAAHVLYLVGTLFTCGLLGPVYGVHWLCRHIWPRRVRSYY